jgi:hypothetical protein
MPNGLGNTKTHDSAYIAVGGEAGSKNASIKCKNGQYEKGREIWNGK